MQFVCDQDTLATWLKRAALFADTKSPMPIYGYTKFDVLPGSLALSAANSTFMFHTEIGLTDLIPAVPGAICVQADRISDLVATLRPNCPVEISCDGPRLHLRSGRTNADLDTLPADQFPTFDTAFRQPQIVTTTGELDRVIGRALPAMGNDPDRAMLWGLSLQYDGSTDGVSAMGCDGTITSLCVLFSQSVSEFPAAIIPRSVCQKLHSLLKGFTGKADISITPNSARITTMEWMIVTKLIDAIYPPHHQLTADPVATPVTLDSDELMAILNRIEAATDLDSKKLKQRGAVATFTDNTMKIRDGLNIIHDVMDAEYGDTAPEEIGFNAAHIATALPAIDASQIELHFSDRASRIRVCAAGDTEEWFTTMPYRVN